MDAIDPIAVARTLLIYLHVLAIAVAAAAVAFGDFAIFARPRIDMAMLQRASRFASAALGVLWVTGLAVILMDIGFDVDLLAGKPKLMAKLTVVVVLTINSIGLHWLAFPRFVAPQVDPLRAATMPVVFVQSVLPRGFMRHLSAWPSRSPDSSATAASWACLRPFC